MPRAGPERRSPDRLPAGAFGRRDRRSHKKIGPVLKNGERRHRALAKTRNKEATMFLLELILDLLDRLEDGDIVIREKF